jgi:hypothetical protein
VRKFTHVVVLVVAVVAGLASSGRATTSATASVHARIRISDVRLQEGSKGFTRAVFTVTVSRPTRASVRFKTVDGTAIGGEDYTAASATLRFTPGKTTRKITVEIVSDQLNEEDETFGVRLFHAESATIVDRMGRATIEDDDGPSFTIGDATAREGQTAAFTVTLSAPLESPAAVGYATSDGSATAPADYQSATGTLTFAVGETVKQVAVPLKADTAAEVNENFGLNLFNPTGAKILDGVGIGTITDDDIPALTIANATVTEGNVGTVNATFTVTLSGPSADAVSLDYATANGSATAPADFQASSGSLSFAPGETAKQVVVQVVSDTVSEVNESFGVNVSNVTGATVSDAVALGSITDDDTPTIAVANVTVTEGNSGTTNAVFAVTLSSMSSQTVSFDYATANGSATAPADFQSGSGTLTFNPGETVQQIVVLVVGDTSIETTESFSLNLTSPVNATFADATAQGTITDNDTVAITIGAATVTETNTGTNRDAVFTVTLSAVSGSTVTVDFTTANGSATAPADYLVVSGTLTFAPGEVSKQVVVQVVGDNTVEANETFSVNLANPTNASIGGSGFGLGTITNND